MARKYQYRRSVSMRPQVYVRLRDHCRRCNKPMTAFVEKAITAFLNAECADPEPPLEQARQTITTDKKKRHHEYVGQHFTF